MKVTVEIEAILTVLRLVRSSFNPPCFVYLDEKQHCQKIKWNGRILKVYHRKYLRYTNHFKVKRKSCHFTYTCNIFSCTQKLVPGECCWSIKNLSQKQPIMKKIDYVYSCKLTRFCTMLMTLINKKCICFQSNSW